MPIASFTSPAFSDGKVVLRMKDALACYDLTTEANLPTPVNTAAK